MNTTWEELLPEASRRQVLRGGLFCDLRQRPEPGHVLDALATFERSLITPDAASTATCAVSALRRPDEERGYELFKVYGCTACP